MFSYAFFTFPYAVLSKVWCMFVSFLTFGLFLALSYEKLFERKSDLVRDTRFTIFNFNKIVNDLDINSNTPASWDCKKSIIYIPLQGML